jgi:preprotein translocase subunit SecB
MIAKKSPFILKNFLLLKQSIEFVSPPNNKKISIPQLFDSYTVDIDFVIPENKTSLYEIFIKVGVNNMEQKHFGYNIFAEGVGIFEFDKSDAITEAEIGNYLYFSGISICINGLRSIISNVTSHGPFGKFTLPSIDVNSLLIEKGILKQEDTLKI